MELSIDRQCRSCGKDFIAFKSNRQFCSAPCQQKGWRDGEKLFRLKEVHFCKRCNTEFETHDKRKTFCSSDCKVKFYNEARPTTKALQRECPQCHKMFVPMQKRGVGKIYCSPSCKRKFNYSLNHETLKDRRAKWAKKNKWGGNWEDCLARDKYTCQLCGLTLTPSQWEGNRRLAVHHRDCSGEADSKNHDIGNLLTLCKKCHDEFHMKISLVFKDGKYFVRGKIFSILNLKQADTIGG